MRLKRFLASGINMFVSIINVFLLIFNISALGCLAFGTYCPSTRKGKFIYGFCSLVQWAVMCTIVGTIIIIVFWAKDQPSLARRMEEALGG